jgi:predicted dehydrogenase
MTVPFDPLRRSTLAAAVLAPFAASSLAAASAAPRSRRAAQLRVGVIGCGGRGTGAAIDALAASPEATIVALGDAFEDRLSSSRDGLKEHDPRRATVDPKQCFVGLDAYQGVLGCDLDVVICATPPGFRPIHVAAAVDAGKHVFLEKPCAVDAPGIRLMLEAAKKADAKGLRTVAGTQRRHQGSYLEAIRRIRGGEIGSIVAARCYWNQGGLWNVEPRSDRSDVENQMRNWLYHAWLSGDHIVEQHVHQLDVLCWAFGTHPTKVNGVGGRQARTDPKFGHIFDHFGLEYTFADGGGGEAFALSMCRQQDGTASKVEECFTGTEGSATLRPGFASIARRGGGAGWTYAGPQTNPYVDEHRDLHEAIRSGTPINEIEQVAHSTLAAIMGRMAAYTGQEVTWEQALASTEQLMPATLAFGPRPVDPVAIPGKTPLV